MLKNQLLFLICNLYAVIKIRVKKCLLDTEVLNIKKKN